MILIARVVLVFIVILVLLTIIWAIFFRRSMSLGAMLWKIIDIALLPFKLVLRLFGLFKPADVPTGVGTTAVDTASSIPLPTIHTTNTEVVRHEIAECPPCNLKCPDPPLAPDTKPLEMEIRYLKDMVKFVGAMARRENAVNTQYQELYPGFSVLSPDVRRLSTEYNFLKNQLREDENEWTYFKNYFTKLSGIPSAASAVHYEVLV